MRIALVAALVLAACRTSAEDPTSALNEDVAASDPLVARAAFFDDQAMYYVRIKNWPSEWMSVNALLDEREAPGATVEVFRANAQSGKHCPDGEANAGNQLLRADAFSIRTSGNKTNGTPKSSYKIKLDGDANRLFGMKSLNLKSMWNDASQMREAIAWQLFKDAKVPAPGHTYAKFCINNRYYGLYSVIENVDKEFVKARFGKSDKGNLFKAYWADVGPADLTPKTANAGQNPGKAYFKAASMDDRSYQLKTNDDEEDAEFQTYDDLAALITAINTDIGFNTPAYRDRMMAIMDVHSFLRWAGINQLLGSWDNYWATPANYYAYNGGPKDEPKKFMTKPFFHWIPWDYDNSLGISYWSTKWQYVDIVDWEASTKTYHGGTKTSKLPLVKNLLKNDEFMRYYLDFVEHMLATKFNPSAIKASRETLWSHVKTAAFLESDTSDCGNTGAHACAHTGRQFSNHEVYLQADAQNELQRGNMRLEGIDHYVKMRYDNVQQQLAKWRLKHPRGSSGATF